MVIIFLTVPILRPPLNFLCRPIMCYSLISLQLKLYFRHSCTFCTPHFFYINSNKTTAGRTKAIHRRREHSCNIYLLLLFVGQNRASKSLLHITPDFPYLAVFSTNKTFEGQLKPWKPFSYRSFSWLTLCGCQVRNKNFCKKKPYKAFNRFLHQFEPCRAYLLIHNSGA